MSNPEYRRDPVTGRWVIVAPERSRRPMALEGAEPRNRINGERQPCPFCPGQEFDTPDEVYALREAGSPPDGPGWRLRVVPNKFPAVRGRLSPQTHGANPQDDGPVPLSFSGMGAEGIGSTPFEAIPAYGRHEVVIESAEHISDPTRLPDAAFRDIFWAYRERLLAHATDPALRYAAVFKNAGAEAGASLGHCHSQIVATPLIPDLMWREFHGSKEYHTRTGHCVFCDILAHELSDHARLVAETPHFAAVTAFAGRFAYETWVLPKNHASRYEEITDARAAEFATLMKRVVRALDGVLAEPAYNWFLHTAPLRSVGLPHYHWHVEVMPRTSRPAGFEWGAGCFINAVSPEKAAAELRRNLTL